MALNITHQIATMAGTAIPVESGAVSGESTVVATTTVSASAVWKSPATSQRCRIQKPEFVDGGVSPPVSPCRSRALSPCRSPPLSPCMSPVLGGIRPDLSVACQAFATEMELAPAAVVEEDSYSSVSEYKEVRGAHDKGKGVPVYVMMPLDSVTMNHTVNRKKAINASLQALKSAGVEGIMMDVWWGLVEGDAPGAYNWGGYSELMEMAKKHGLKVQAVMSFHQCGGNVGDSCKYVLIFQFFFLFYLLRFFITRLEI